MYCKKLRLKDTSVDTTLEIKLDVYLGKWVTNGRNCNTEESNSSGDLWYSPGFIVIYAEDEEKNGHLPGIQNTNTPMYSTLSM